MAKKSPRVGECVYCGEHRQLTDDHVPPRCFFEGRQGLVVVPSCWCCNNRAKKDDEHFRQSIVLHENVANLPEATPAVDKVVRSLFKPEAKGMLRDFLSRTRVFEDRTPAGIYHVRTTTDVETERIDRVAERITRGLFWCHQGYRLPDRYVVHVASCEELRHARDERSYLMAQRAQELLEGQAYAVRDGSVFFYFVQFDETDPNLSDWLFWFFGAFFIFAGTAPA